MMISVTQSVLRLNTFLATNHTNLTLIAKYLMLLFVSTFVSLVAKENQIQEGLL